MYVIQDKETQNYLSTRSFWTMDGISWELYEYTGKLGTEFNSTREQAKESLEFLNKYNKLSGFNRKLHIIEVDTDNLPLGKTVIKNSNDLKVINFPLVSNTDESADLDQFYKALSEEQTEYTSKDKCYRCKKPLDENDFIWFINQQAGYGSKIDGDRVSIKICDDCIIKFLGK